MNMSVDALVKSILLVTNYRNGSTLSSVKFRNLEDVVRHEPHRFGT